MVDDTAEDDNIVNSALLKEYKSQLATFDATIESLISAPVPTNNPMAKNRLNAIKREIKRLQSHLPIYAQRKELIDAVRFNRVLVLKADTGSGKSTQLVQYLVDAGFADQGIHVKNLSCIKMSRFSRSNNLYSTTSIGSSSVGNSSGRRIRLSSQRRSKQVKI
jgi:hypothetical protein